MDTLPTWGQMTDLDKGAALLHLHKRRREGASYAIDEYPAEYFDHPALTALDRLSACQHAARLAPHERELSAAEHARLYDLALDADRDRWHARTAARTSTERTTP